MDEGDNIDSQANLEFSHLQDVLGNVSTHQRYIVLCPCFRLQESVSALDVQNVLKSALETLTDAFPFLAGQVVFKCRDNGDSGRPNITPLEKSIQLLFNDMRDEPSVPTMARLHQAKYPFSMLNAALLIPPIAISWPEDADFQEVAPVLALQANLIRGGLLLTIAGNHLTMDLTGMAHIIALFAKACRGEAFATEEIRIGNQDRRNIIPLLGEEYQIGPELDDVIVTTLDAPDHGLLKPLRWVYFRFSVDNLARLKEEASKQDLAPYVSTDDALTALCWQSVSQARLPRLGTGNSTILARPIDVRKYLGLEGYLGHMVDVVYDSEVDVWDRPLGEIAGRLRRELLQDSKIRYHVRAYATALSRLTDKSKMMNGAHLDPDRDVIVVSYANARCCELSFGAMLGKPDVAILPGSVNSLAANLIIMPKSVDDAIAVAACLREDELDRLCRGSFTTYAEYVG